MSDQPSLSGRSVALVGLILVAVLVVAFFAWRPRAAPSGQLPAVAPSDPRAELPLDGYALPGLSAADSEKLKNGQSVELRVGEGSITIQSTKPAD